MVVFYISYSEKQKLATVIEMTSLGKENKII